VFEYLPMPFSLSKRQQKFLAALGTTSARSSISIWSSQSESEAEESDNDVSEQTREDDEHHSFGGCPMDASEAHVNVYLFSS
jgi:hypothetical protein